MQALVGTVPSVVNTILKLSLAQCLISGRLVSNIYTRTDGLGGEIIV